MEWTDLFSNLLYFLTNSQMDVGKSGVPMGSYFRTLELSIFGVDAYPSHEPILHVTKHPPLIVHLMFLNPRNPLWPVDLGC